MQFPETFSAQDADGNWRSIAFQKEPIFVAGLIAAQAMFHNGPRLNFMTVTNRSSLLAVVNNALNESGSTDESCLGGARIGGPELFERPMFERMEDAEGLLTACGATINWGGAHACYIAAHDEIRMPDRERFARPVNAYAVA